MKLRNIFRILSAGVVFAGLASCHNQEKIFPDYEGGISAYFAYQMPVRTIVLGESETFDTSLDNQHKCIIYGTIGGSYKGKDVVIGIDVDNSLADNVFYPDGTPVKAMPESYYTLSSDKLDYAGTHMGGVEVTLTDAFFADPDAIKNTYVIPVVMTNIIKGADQIKTGTPLIEGESPIRTNAALWNVQPMDYTLYGIKYVNQWDGSWLRRGVDVITGQDAGTVVRHGQYVENDEVVYLTTESLDAVTIPVSTNVTNSYTETIVGDAGYGLHMTNTTKQDANWGSQVWYSLAEPMKAGVTYTFKCMAKATLQYDWCSVFLQSADGNTQDYSHGMPFTTEWKETVMSIYANADVYEKLTFNFGDKAITLMLDNVSLIENGTTEELIPNGDFENGETNGWTSWTDLQSVGMGCGGFNKVENVEVSAKTCNLVITFDETGAAKITSATEGVAASGKGQFVKDGEKLAWGNKDRDALYLEYDVDFGAKQYHVTDTLVARSREVKMETYIPTYINK